LKILLMLMRVFAAETVCAEHSPHGKMSPPEYFTH
jgi:hypothetical protein